MFKSRRIIIDFVAFCLVVTGLPPAGAADREKTLEGKVEKKDALERVVRPGNGGNGEVLNRSVKVLSGFTAARADDFTLDSLLKEDNFNLPYHKLNPQPDQLFSSEAGANAGLRRQPGRLNWQSRNFEPPEDWNLPQPGTRLPCDKCLRARLAWQRAFELQRVQARLSTPEALDPAGFQAFIPKNQAAGFPFTRLSKRQEISPSPPPQIYEEKSVLWDAWYDRVSNALYQNWLGKGRQPGEATLQVSVRRPRQIQAEVLHSSNQSPAFKQSLQDAVASLNGSPVLDFPGQSMKQQVSFSTVFSAGVNTASGAFSERRGDIEQVRIKR